MTTLDLELIKDRLAKAHTEWGEWAVQSDEWGECHHVIIRDDGPGYSIIAEGIGQGEDDGLADATFIAHAPSDLAALLAEVEELRESVRKFSDDLLFGDGITEPAATLNDMVDPIRDAFEAQHDHIECPIICELCGEKLADKTCEHCHGSGADNQAASAAGAWVECEWCGGAGKIHEGCVEKSYADIATENSVLRAQIDAVRAVTANHPNPCSKHPEDDPVSCGWKSAYIDVVETLAC